MHDKPKFNKPALYITPLSYQAKGFSTTFPVYSMVVGDEFITRTPDALLHGYATEQVIENCCPTLDKVSQLPICDINHILACIKIATTGGNLEFSTHCPNCQGLLPCEIPLQANVGHLSAQKWYTPLSLEEVQIFLNPPSYKEFSDFSIKDYQYNRQLYQLSKLESPDDYGEVVSRLVEDKKKLLLNYHMQCIEKITIQANGKTTNNRSHINEWFNKCDVASQQQISEYINEAMVQSKFEKISIVCDECEKPFSFPLELDFSTLFRYRLVSMSEQQIVDEINQMGEESKRLTNDLLKMIWYMRGSISYTEMLSLTSHERTCIAKIIEENLEITKKIGMPFV